MCPTPALTRHLAVLELQPALLAGPPALGALAQNAAALALRSSTPMAPSGALRWAHPLRPVGVLLLLLLLLLLVLPSAVLRGRRHVRRRQAKVGTDGGRQAAWARGPLAGK